VAAQSSLRPVRRSGDTFRCRKERSLRFGRVMGSGSWRSFCDRSSLPDPVVIGNGLGFSAVSPWSNNGASAAAIGSGAIVWLILTQVLASALGGYLGGRLRTKWTGVHTDEVYFRDTAHGLLVWAVGMVITAGFLASSAASFATEG
jgi:hypothetical protein